MSHPNNRPRSRPDDIFTAEEIDNCFQRLTPLSPSLSFSDADWPNSSGFTADASAGIPLAMQFDSLVLMVRSSRSHPFTE